MASPAAQHQSVEVPVADLAILLVHGIGQQKAGSVVDQVGNAVLEWLSARVKGSGRTVEIEQALLKPGIRGDAGCARLMLLVRDKNGAPERRLQLAESLWVEEFDPPGFFEVLRWILGPGAWLLLRHIVNMPVRLYRLWLPSTSETPDWLWVISAVLLGFVGFFLLVMPMQLIGILTALFRLLPIPYLQNQRVWLGRVVSEVLGDSYLFARNPVVRRALADRVRRDLDNLSADGAPVVVLAHSQGAAVAFDMLEQHPKPPPLVTYGAGIRKLHELVGNAATLAQVPGVFHHLWWLAPLWFAALVGAGINLRAVMSGSVAFSQWAGISFTVLFGFYLVSFVMGGLALLRSPEIDKSLGARVNRLLVQQPAWLDIFATHDPVPAGPLVTRKDASVTADGFLRTPRTGSLDSLEVVNQMRVSADHTCYWDNPDGFIDPVAHWIGRAYGYAWRPEPSGPLRTWCKRRVRTCVRKWTSVILLIQVGILLFIARDQWPLWLPTAETVSQALAGRLPGAFAMMKPLITSLVVTSYGAVAMMLVLALHLVALSAYDVIVLGSAWRSFDRQLALAGSTRWYNSLWRFGVFFVLFSVAAYSLGIAIMNASYGPLVHAYPVDTQGHYRW